MKVKIHVYMYRQLLASHKVKHQSEEVQVYGICICMLNLSVLSVLIIFKVCIHFVAFKVVHSKSSDKLESSLTLRVALSKS